MTINSKSTKQEIMEVLEFTKLQLNEKAKETNDLMAELEKTRKAKVLSSANQSVSSNLFSEELNTKLNDLNEAISVQSDNLKELYDIEKEYQNLLVITTASKEAQYKLNDDLQSKKSEINIQIEAMKDEYSKKQNDLKLEYSQLKGNLELEREREGEQYKYDVKRNREKENDSWSDEKLKRELELKKKEEIAKQLLKDAEVKVDYISELEQKIETIPSLLIAAKEEGISETSKELGKEYGYKKSMNEKEFEFKEQLLKNQNATLEKELAKLNSEKETLQTKLDDAYAQLSTLATETVKSSGGVKILGNNGSTEMRK